ncbi:MAG: prepilin-type N-terminal cleavage/methylation domain-containing protein [Acidobacteria bacterium]|nr:MAG: prepilin-type N-terminal cleavage/methylation domain-containing protein [Acidobacteriota bacterium]
MNQSRISKDSGFTLIESMIALAVMAITLLGLGQLVSTAVRQNAATRFETMGVLIVQEKLEALRGAYNRELESETGSSDLTAGSHGPETLIMEAPAGSSMGDSEFEVSWTVTIAGSQKTVNVTVEPQVSNQLITDLSLTTIFVP